MHLIVTLDKIKSKDLIALKCVLVIFLRNPIS